MGGVVATGVGTGHGRGECSADVHGVHPGDGEPPRLTSLATLMLASLLIGGSSGTGAVSLYARGMAYGAPMMSGVKGTAGATVGGAAEAVNGD